MSIRLHNFGEVRQGTESDVSDASLWVFAQKIEGDLNSRMLGVRQGKVMGSFVVQLYMTFRNISKAISKGMREIMIPSNEYRLPSVKVLRAVHIALKWSITSSSQDRYRAAIEVGKASSMGRIGVNMLLDGLESLLNVQAEKVVRL